MADMFDEGASLVSETRHASLSQAVSYTRGATSLSIYATASRPETLREFPGDAVQIDTDRKDWIIRVEDLGALELPARGDTVEEASGAVWRVGVDGTDAAFVPCDAYGYDLRVQCVRVPA